MEGKSKNIYKVILVGEANVGKSSIIYNYTTGKFRQNTLNTITNSFSNKTITIYNKELAFEIWDTAGQEKYRSFTRICYKNVDAVIFVYDVTSSNSFNQIKEYWYNDVMNNISKNPICALAANKCDLFDREEVNEEEGRNYAKEYNLIFNKTSAYSSVGIEELFIEIANKLLEIENKESNTDNSIKLDKQNHRNEKNKSTKCCYSI